MANTFGANNRGNGGSGSIDSKCDLQNMNIGECKEPNYQKSTYDGTQQSNKLAFGLVHFPLRLAFDDERGLTGFPLRGGLDLDLEFDHSGLHNFAQGPRFAIFATMG